MKKIINTLKIVVFSTILGACSSENDVTPVEKTEDIEEQNTNINKVVYYESDYGINHFEYTSFAQRINLELFNISESELDTARESGELLKNVDYFYISLEGADIQQKTYSLDEISTVYFVLNGEFEYGDIEEGIEILNTKSASLKPISGTLIVTKVTPADLEFNFEFTRGDGEVITGEYKGDNNYVSIVNSK